MHAPELRLSLNLFLCRTIDPLIIYILFMAESVLSRISSLLGVASQPPDSIHIASTGAVWPARILDHSATHLGAEIQHETQPLSFDETFIIALLTFERPFAIEPMSYRSTWKTIEETVE